MTDTVSSPTPKIWVKDLSFFYGSIRAIDNLNLEFEANKVTALIGPSGCGKTTLLRCINRMCDLDGASKQVGKILVDGVDIRNPSIVAEELRKKIGMVFQKPTPFPGSIYRNVSYGPSIHGVSKGSQLDDLVEECLLKAGLWEEVRDNLDTDALRLSGGQQQRLCIARALAVKPEILLMDEPCSALDPIATTRIEDLIHELKQHLTVVLVTHNMQQAQRASDYTAFLVGGKLIEFGVTRRIFLHPLNKQTDDYISGRFG